MAASQNEKGAEKHKRFLKMKREYETAKKYFFKYAFPCAFLPFKRGEITEKGYDKLKRQFCEGESPSKKELEKTFPFAFKMIKRLAKRMKRNYWDIDVIKEYWVREHNRIIDAKESYFKSKSDRFRDLCRINKAGVISTRGNVLIVKYGNKKRKVYSTIVPYIKRGDIVTIHFSYAIEKVK